MTVLDDIISASTDSSVPVSDLLRKVQIAASRLGASGVEAWVKGELGGYADVDLLPHYRVLRTNVEGIFEAVGNPPQRRLLAARPAEMDGWWTVHLNAPAMEIQALSESQNDSTRPWPAPAVLQYREFGAYANEYWVLSIVHNLITPQSLRGVLDVIRSKALEFALELQKANPAAGSVGGPTLASEPRLATVVYNVTNNIVGDGANVATGTDISQRTTITKGDAAALVREAQALGLSAGDAQEFVEVLSEEESVEKPKVKRFLEKVRTGAIVLSGSVTSDVAAGSLIELAKAFLGL